MPFINEIFHYKDLDNLAKYSTVQKVLHPGKARTEKTLRVLLVMVNIQVSLLTNKLMSQQ
jgi:hypothetical protein